MRCVQETGVFRFQVLVAVGYALSISQPDKHQCLPCRGQSFGTPGEFSYQHAERHTRETKTSVCLERQTRHACSPLISPLSRQHLLTSLFACVFIWYHLSVGGTASDRRPLDPINKIRDAFIHMQTSASSEQNFLTLFITSFQACSTHSFQGALLKRQMSYLPLLSRALRAGRRWQTPPKGPDRKCSSLWEPRGRT